MTFPSPSATIAAPRALVAVSRPAAIRALGTAGILASPWMAIEGKLLPLAEGTVQHDVVVGACSLVYILGFAASAVGLRLVRGTGEGRAARAVFLVQMIGLTLATLWALQLLLTPAMRWSALQRVADLAWPLSHVYMLVVAGMVMRARRLLGWRRIPAFVCGLALPVTVALQQWVAPAAANVAFPLLTTLGFALLGVVVRSAADGAPAPR